MADANIHLARFEELVSDLFAELGDFELTGKPSKHDAQGDVVVVSASGGPTYHFDAKVRERITPQIAGDFFERLQAEPTRERVIRIVYAPVISPRVAEIAGQYGLSYIDYAGNCRIVDRASGLLISRSGIRNKASHENRKQADPFSPKSSRIVRAMLHEPDRGWQVSELAGHPDVEVSVGLVSKVKQTLLQERFAVLSNRLLYLKQPIDLLTAWTKKYPGPTKQRQFYVREDTEEIESRMSDWCERSHIDYALARLSAAWRLAPEVRYSVATVYVNADAFRPSSLESLRADCGAKEVTSGANLVLLTPFDQSVFVRCEKTAPRTTSPLQTYLDLQSMAGRGSEAAEAVFEKHLRAGLESAHGEEEGA